MLGCSYTPVHIGPGRSKGIFLPGFEGTLHPGEPGFVVGSCGDVFDDGHIFHAFGYVSSHSLIVFHQVDMLGGGGNLP